jgi:hypothetical protein
MFETIFLILTVMCIICYLGGQVKNSHYEKSNTVYILVMLILTVLGYLVASYVTIPLISYGFPALIWLTILIINILEYKGVNV